MVKIKVVHEFIVTDEETGKELGRTDDIKKLAELRRGAFETARKAELDDPKSLKAKIEQRRLARIQRIRSR